jgi:hypothetical protein
MEMRDLRFNNNSEYWSKISMIYVTGIACGFRSEKPIIQPALIGIKNGLSD